MALTSVQICANALLRLGATPIQSFTDGTDLATICNGIYNQKKAYMLSSYPWSFSFKYIQLSRQTATPTAQWSYKFTLPADRVISGMPEIYSSSTVGAVPLPSDYYELVGNVLMSDETELWCKYQYNVDESLWPAYFTELMINIMKVELALPVTENTQLYQELKLETYGTPSEGGSGGLVNMTRFLDSRDNPVTYIRDQSLIIARYTGTIYGTDYTVED